MNDTKRDSIRKALERAGSLEALLEEIVRSESDEFRKHQQEVERGTDHPSADLLREYAFGRVSREEDRRLTEHISLCGVCAHEVFKLQYSEEESKDTVIGWMVKLRNFVSSLSFPVAIYAPALEPVRGTMADQERRYKPGTDLVLSIEGPDDGYVAVFHGCEETGKVELVFPVEPEDNPRVAAGQEMPPITGKVEGPSGKHWFKMFWTRQPQFDPPELDLATEYGRHLALEEFCDRVAQLSADDFRINVVEYDVVNE